MSEAQLQALQTSLGLMCVKNSNGQYCMEVAQGFKLPDKGNTKSPYDVACESACSSCNKALCPSCEDLASQECTTCAAANNCAACVTCSRSTTACQLTPGQVQAFQDLGCCYGVLIQASNSSSSLDSPSSSSGSGSGSSSRDAGATLTAALPELSKCGVMGLASPCPLPGTPTRQVAVSTTIAGLTVATFDSSAQNNFRAGLAKTAGVNVDQVIITRYSSATVRRAEGLQVDTEITLTGDAAVSEANANKIQAKAQDTTTLASNLQAQGMSAVTVTASAATVAPIVAAAPVPTSSASSSGDGNMGVIIAVAVCGVVLVVVAIGGVYFVLAGKSSASASNLAHQEHHDIPIAFEVQGEASMMPGGPPPPVYAMEMDPKDETSKI